MSDHTATTPPAAVPQHHAHHAAPMPVGATVVDTGHAEVRHFSIPGLEDVRAEVPGGTDPDARRRRSVGDRPGERAIGLQARRVDTDLTWQACSALAAGVLAAAIGAFASGIAIAAVLMALWAISTGLWVRTRRAPNWQRTLGVLSALLGVIALGCVVWGMVHATETGLGGFGSGLSNIQVPGLSELSKLSGTPIPKVPVPTP